MSAQHTLDETRLIAAAPELKRYQVILTVIGIIIAMGIVGQNAPAVEAWQSLHSRRPCDATNGTCISR